MAEYTPWEATGKTRDVTHTSSEQTVIRKDGDLKVLSDSNDVDMARTHTAKSDFVERIPYDDSLFDWILGDVFHYYDGTFLFRGELERVETDERRAETSIQGPGVGGKLERGVQQNTFEATSVRDALSYYINVYTDFLGNVFDREPRTIIDNDVIQFATTGTQLRKITDFAETDPIGIKGNQIEVLQSLWVKEGEFAPAPNIFSTKSDAAYSGKGDSNGEGLAAEVKDAGDWIEWEFTNEYTIPREAFDFWARAERSSNDVWEFRITIDGESIGNEPFYPFGVEWVRAVGGIGEFNKPNSDIEPGTHTVRLEATTVPSNETWWCDVVAMGDSRFNYNFSNSPVTGPDGNRWLPGPELRPDLVETILTPVERDFNIASASTRISTNNDAHNFAVALSNDGGDTWIEVENETDVSVDFDETFGTSVMGRLKLSRYGSRSKITPLNGWAGQAIAFWELSATGNDLAVINEMTVEDNHLKNLQRIAEHGDWRFVIRHLEDDLQIDAFRAGTETRTARWTTINRRKRLNLDEYANVVTVRGALKDDGTRYEFTAEDSDEIDARGRREYVERNPSFTSDEEVLFRAQRLLQEKVDEDDTTGQIEIFPTIVSPGYVYHISAWDADVELEEVRYRIGEESADGTLQFDFETGMAESIASLRKDTDEFKSSL